MKWISWQLVVIIAVICLCVTALELFALLQGIDGTVLSLTIGGLITIPSVILIKKARKKVE